MLFALGWMLLATSPSPTSTIPSSPAATEAREERRVTLWTDRDDPYPRGAAARIYLSLDQPAYVSVVRVDTDGRIQVLFPRHPWGDNHVESSQSFEVEGGRGGHSFIIDDHPGIGYLFAVASSTPLDFGDLTRGDYWDYRLIDGGRIQGDPYVALTDLAARIAPEGDYDYDVVPYYVERHYEYPRFVCYDCHAYASYSDWDPYRTSCSRFRVVVRDDPRYYPYRYGGGRNVVAVRPVHPGPRYLFRDAEPGRAYVTRVPTPEAGRPPNFRENDQGRTSEDIGGQGSVAAPRTSVWRRPGRIGGAETKGLRPAPAPRSTGEPELRRRRP